MFTTLIRYTRIKHQYGYHMHKLTSTFLTGLTLPPFTSWSILFPVLFLLRLLELFKLELLATLPFRGEATLMEFITAPPVACASVKISPSTERFSALSRSCRGACLFLGVEYELLGDLELFAVLEKRGCDPAGTPN